MKKTFIILVTLFYLFPGCSTSSTTTEEKEPNKPNYTVDRFAAGLKTNTLPFYLPPNTKLDTIQISDRNKTVVINFSKEFSYIPLRADNVKKFYDDIKQYFGGAYDGYDFTLRSMNIEISELIPNFYRSKSDYDENRISKSSNKGNVVNNISKPYKPELGLNDRNIVLWHSHGWYYNNELKRWEWQRPRLFQAVEDRIPMSFTLPYLIPMLENAGANVFVPRERDTQINEVVVDNDKNDASYTERGTWTLGKTSGFKLTSSILTVQNPFKLGTYRQTNTSSDETATITYKPQIPEDGYYAVYISYAIESNSASDVEYTVNHSGGKTIFKVDQSKGGGTWMYLGTFKFKKGSNSIEGSVVVSNKSRESGKIVTSDAVRFGGGWGIIEREGQLSGRPKFLEGSRYWLQYAGMPDTLIWDMNKGENDYNDDYQSRGEYANYLKGAPYGPNRERDNQGLNIPIDLSMAFHTDAGITYTDTVVGSLSIYSITDFDRKKNFPDGVSRLANRDLADIVQTEVVNDVRNSFDPIWTRRDLREAQYSESSRPNMPDLLLELLSHQNFLDMRYVYDPQFRFTVSRAIYKGMLKFLSSQYDFEYAVQPLPVDHFSTEFNTAGQILLKWHPVLDKSEPTAAPEKYLVYTRLDDNGFDNGTITSDTFLVVNNIKSDVIYSFKVAAINKGGEGFPSEILSVGRTENLNRQAIVVNAFDRVSGPGWVNDSSFSGFVSRLDAGVPDKYDYPLTGMQYDYNLKSDFITNDAPGHGASTAEFENRLIAGNSFDFPYIHGKALLSNGVSFVSSSDESIEDGQVSLNNYKMADIICGKEKETLRQKETSTVLYGSRFKLFTEPLKQKINSYINASGNLLLTGAFIGSELFNNPRDTNSIKWANDVLKIKYGTPYASTTGKVESFSGSKFRRFTDFYFNTTPSEKIYFTENADEITPINGSSTILRYKDNKFSAGTAFKDKYGVIVLGFPFEIVTEPTMQNNLMKGIVEYFGL